MPIGTAFHEKTRALCTSYRWKDWAGYHAVCSYDICHEPEYFAFRHSAGLIDVSPLYKYDVKGPDAGRFLAWLTVKDITTLKPNQVTYCCWCDDFGKVIDDGTVTFLGENHYRVTAAEPTYAWMLKHSRGFKIEVTDLSEKIAVLSLQGPNSKAILKSCIQTSSQSKGDIGDLKFFYATQGQLKAHSQIDVLVTRTGYTGDLGYEIWCDQSKAHQMWDGLLDAGRAYGIEPCGLDAMDVTRVEAGFILNGVDYFSAHHCWNEARKSSPYELGLGWMVKLDREPFMGQKALRAEKAAGSPWTFVGLDIDWDETEAVFAKHGLPPQVSSKAWRTAVPIYNAQGKHVGQATSGSWSPVLKKNLALASIQTPYADLGTELRFEITAEYHREQVKATLVKTPFFNPERKRA